MLRPKPLFRDRHDAGRQLARELSKYARDPKVIVLGLPRGGVPVAYEVARALHVPLDVFIVRKLGVPGHAELAMGAIASGGTRVLNEDLTRYLEIPEAVIDKVAREEGQELERREHLYRDNLPPPDVAGRTVILVDDGLATGATVRAAVTALKQLHPQKIVAAVPTAARETCDAMRGLVDEIVCASTPEPFLAVGVWYVNFGQTTDDEVRYLLRRARRAGAAPSPAGAAPGTSLPRT